MTLAEGITLGPYEIISPLGAGGTVSAPLSLPNDGLPGSNPLGQITGLLEGRKFIVDVNRRGC